MQRAEAYETVSFPWIQPVTRLSGRFKLVSGHTRICRRSQSAEINLQLYRNRNRPTALSTVPIDCASHLDHQPPACNCAVHLRQCTSSRRNGRRPPQGGDIQRYIQRRMHSPLRVAISCFANCSLSFRSPSTSTSLAPTSRSMLCADGRTTGSTLRTSSKPQVSTNQPVPAF